MARKKKAEDAGAGAPWLSTFADLMNLLLCFFVLLFASSNVDQTKYEKIVSSLTGNFKIINGGSSILNNNKIITNGITQLSNIDEYIESVDGSDVSTENITMSEAIKELLEQKKAASQAMYDKISDMSDQKKLTDYMDLSIDPNFQYVRIALSGSVLFDSGKADIKKDALPIFSKIGDILKVYKSYHIEIEGHTDNVPIHNSAYSNNNWLSSARALNAAMYLMNEKGMDPETLSWTGRGEYDPVASNSTEEGRAKNRRIEIKIYNDIEN